MTSTPAAITVIPMRMIKPLRMNSAMESLHLDCGVVAGSVGAGP
jgi:hypothetical protein